MITSRLASWRRCNRPAYWASAVLCDGDIDAGAALSIEQFDGLVAELMVVRSTQFPAANMRLDSYVTFINGCANQARIPMPRCAVPGNRDSETARKQSHDEESQERSAYRP